MDTVASAIAVPAAELRHRRVRGLLLVTAMAADSGHHRTPAGRAVYYVLVPEQEQVSTPPEEGAASPPQGTGRGSRPRDQVNSGDGEL